MDAEENREEQAVSPVPEEKKDAPEDVMQALLKCGKKQLFYARLSALFCGLLFAAVALALVILVPQVLTTLNNANTTMNTANAAIAEIQDSIDDIDAMVTSITKTSEDMNALIEGNAQTLTDSVQKMSEIDFDGINVAIKDLQDAIGPLADAMNKMSTFSLFGR